MMISPPDVERAETAATTSPQQGILRTRGDVGADGAGGQDRGRDWRHGLSPLVAPGLCSPLAMMIMGFDDEEDDAYWHATHRTKGAFTNDDDEESKLESLAASSFVLPVTYCEPVEDLLFDRSPGASCGDAVPTMIQRAGNDPNKKRKRVRFAIDYHDEIPMTTRTSTDEILLAANAAAARTSPILANPCLSPTVPATPAPLTKEESTLPATAGPGGDVDIGDVVTNPLSLRKKKKRRRSNDDPSTKDRYVMGKEEQPSWIRRNRLALLVIFLGLVLICAVAIPLATMSSASSSSPSPAIGTAANRTTTNTTSSSTNGTSLNGSWTDGDGVGSSDNRDNRTDPDSGQAAERRCFASNGELRTAIDTWLWASKLRKEQQETPQALYDLANTYGWPMNNWCTANITNMSHLLSVERNPLAVSFNQNISLWDVRSVRDFSYLFLGAARFSHDVSRWRVSRAIHMDGMFQNASSYNHNLCAWGRRLVIGRGDGTVSVSVSVEQMFRGSGCRSTADPNLDATPPSPLCAPCSSDDSRL